VVVNLADSEFSGRRAFLIAVRFVAVSFAAFTSSLLLLLMGWVSSVGVAVGMSIWYSLIIWSAILRRSEERMGERVLIYRLQRSLAKSSFGTLDFIFF
jgi:hypothetical protein